MKNELFEEKNGIVPRILTQTGEYIQETLRGCSVDDSCVLIEYLNGGKKLRPFILASFVEILGGDNDIAARLAASVEMYHNATLIFDDIQDNSLVRRGRPTLNKRFGTGVALSYATVLRALITKPFTGSLVGEKFNDVSQWINKIAIMLSEGQLAEMLWAYKKQFDVSENEYLRMVKNKTGSLIGLAAVFGGIAASFEKKQVLFEIGCDLGVAYQILDDIANIKSDKRQLKDKYSDIHEKKITLLLLKAMRVENWSESLRHTYLKEQISEREVPAVVDIFERSGAIRECFEIAMSYVQRALEKLSHLPFADPDRLADFTNRIEDIFKNA